MNNKRDLKCFTNQWTMARQPIRLAHCIKCGSLTQYDVANSRKDVNGMYCEDCYQELINRKKCEINEL